MENNTEDANSTEEESVTPNCHNDYCLSDQDYIAMVEEHIQPTSGEWALVAVFVVLFIVGLIGNFLVCYAVIKNSQMRTVTNLFIMNLAIADLMVILICLPPTLLVDVSETWFFGEVMCKIFLYFQVDFLFFIFSLNTEKIHSSTKCSRERMMGGASGRNGEKSIGVPCQAEVTLAGNTSIYQWLHISSVATMIEKE